jgi:hypothetical protein
MGKAEAVSRLVTAYGEKTDVTLWVASELTPPARGQWSAFTAWVGAAAELVESALRLVASRVELCETEYAHRETLTPIVVLLDETAPWGLVSPVRDAAERMRVNLIMVNRDGTVTPGPSPFAPARDESETEQP